MTVKIAALITALSFLLFPTYVFADAANCPSGMTADPANNGQCIGGANSSPISVGQPVGLKLSTPAINNVVPNLFKIFFIVGAIAVVLMLLWGAVEWIFSGGDKEKVGHARGRIINALIGFAILALAFLIAVVIGRIVGFNPLQNFDVPFLGASPSP